MVIIGIFHKHGKKKFEGVGYDEIYDDDMEICRYLALPRYCLEPIRCRLK